MISPRNGHHKISAFDAAGNESQRATPRACARTLAQPPHTGHCDYVIYPGESINTYSGVGQPGEAVCIKAGIYIESPTHRVSGSAAAGIINFKTFPGEGSVGAPYVWNGVSTPPSPICCDVPAAGSRTRGSRRP